ncbi:MAG: tetratricopeptide repeat protein [Chloroflexales bacterium]|nr:tetratricopeptide repeat protein [Chloroflexales bacterium]
MLRLLLFGTPRIERDGAIVPVQRTKALALLAYLAVTQQPQDRDGLLALLWPDRDAASARNNLRRDLSVLKAALGDELLVADRLRVVWNEQAPAWVDVAAFGSQIAVRHQHAHADNALCGSCAAALTTAVQLYRDDFLAGFGLPECATFEEWQFFQREALRQQLASAAQALSGWHGERGDYDAAIGYARRWLALDGLHEPAQRALMRLYAQSGQPTAAVRQYAESARLLDRELGAEPEAETRELYAQIRARTFAKPAERATGRQNDRSVPARHNLPPTTGFVGRARELADIIRRLTDPQCRLLTLVGPGGIGKTRLALQVAQTLADTWAGDDEIADGVLFVPLAAVDASSGLISALAAAARFDFYTNVPPPQQVLDFFHAKKMLVVLDNFEQLIDEAGFVGELLAAAAGLRLLVTSRVALNLRDEWFHPIDGLSFPAGDDDHASVAQLARFDAIRLFEQHARRARNDFSLAGERAHVVRLCRLVEGAPLAIELSASWLKLLSVAQVVAALERGQDVLTTTSKDIPARHRSMRTVLEESWRLLSAEEQPILARLAVFVGDFSAAAAQAVAGASLATLAALVDKSLLRTAAGGRFQLHELLRQFAWEQLAAAHEDAATNQQHSAYYLAWLHMWSNAFVGGDEQAKLAEWSGDAENMRAAWQWAVAQRDGDAIERALEPLFNFYQTQGRYQEGLLDFGAAAAMLAPSSEPTAHLERKQIYARLRARQGALCYFLGDYSVASLHIEESLQLARALALKSEEAFALRMLGLVSEWRGDYGVAQQQLRESLAISRALGDQSGPAIILEHLAELLGDLGDYQGAKRLALESLQASRELRRPDWLARALDRVGYTLFCLGEHHEAMLYYPECLALFESIGDQRGRALALGGMGLIEWAEGRDGDAQARLYFEQSLAIYRKIGHQQHIAERLTDLSHLASDRGEYAQAQQHAHEGLLIARRLGSAVHIACGLCCLGRATYEQGNFERGRAHLVEALQAAVALEMAIAGTTTLFYAVVLLLKQRPSSEINERVWLQRRLRAIEILEGLSCQPAAWHMYQARARRLRDELQRDLPLDLAEAAAARGQQLSWQAGVQLLLAAPEYGALDQPAPA